MGDVRLYSGCGEVWLAVGVYGPEVAEGRFDVIVSVVERESAFLAHSSRSVVAMGEGAPQCCEIKSCEGMVDKCGDGLCHEPLAPIGGSEPIAHFAFCGFGSECRLSVHGHNAAASNGFASGFQYNGIDFGG